MSGPAGRPGDRPLRDDELVRRLRDTFQHEAAALRPFTDRFRSIASLEARRTRAATRRRRFLGTAAAVALVGATLGVVTAVHRLDSTTPVGVVGTTSGPSSRGTTRPGAPRRTGAAPGTGELRPRAGSAVPSGFVPISVTFVPTPVGWALGTVPCGTSRCLDLVHTTDAGATWVDLGQPQPRAVASPSLPATAGAAAQLHLGVRFANELDGWIYGTADDESLLWSTVDGGETWTADTLPATGAGATVSGLETTNGHVQLVELTAVPPEVHILTAPDGTQDWTVSTTALDLGSGPDPSPDLVLQRAGGWLVEDDGTVVAGARLTASGTWASWAAPCRAGTSALLASAAPRSVVAVCRATGAPSTVLSSSDGGSSFRATGELPAGVSASALTAATPDTVVAGGARGGGGVIMVSRDRGQAWAAAYTSRTYTDLRQIGFETATQGVAIAASPGGAELLMTFDAGRSWQPVSFDA